MLPTVQCAACGRTTKSLNPHRPLPMCRSCALERIADADESEVTSIPVNLLTYDPTGDGEYRSPVVKVDVRFEGQEAIRILMGTELLGPSIFFERQPTGWHIVLHPDAGDPVGGIMIQDTGEIRFEPDAVHGCPVMLSHDGACSAT